MRYIGHTYFLTTVAFQPDLQRLTSMIKAAETASFSSVLESQRLLEETTQFVAQLQGDDLEEAKLKLYEAKFKMQMEVPLLSEYKHSQFRSRRIYEIILMHRSKKR